MTKLKFQNFYVKFVFVTSVICISSIPNSFAQKGNEYFRNYSHARNFFLNESKFQNFIQQCSHGLDSTFCPDEPEAFEPEGDIYALKCEQVPQGSSQDPVERPKTAQNNTPHAQKFFYLGAETINNNTALGAAYALGLGKPGNDLSGWTYGSKFSFAADLNGKQKIGARASNNLYVRDALSIINVNPEDKNKYDYKEWNAQMSKSPVQYLDVRSIELFYSNSDFKGFSFEASLGAEFLTTTETDSKKVLGSRTMNWWHRTLRSTGLDKDIEEVQVISSHGTPTGYKETREERFNGILGYYPVPELKALPSTRYLANVSIGKKTDIIRGYCVVEFKTGASLSADKEHFIGPNSFVHTSAEITSSAFKNKKGLPLVTGSMNGALVYFPRTFTQGASQVGTRQSFTVALNQSIGKKDGSLQYFFRMLYRQGAQVNSVADDHQPMSTLGMKWNIRQ